MVFLVYVHPPSFLRLPTAGALPVSRSPISLLEAEVTSSRLGQRLAVGTRPLAFPPSIRIVPVQTPDLLRTAPSRCQFCAPLSSLLPLQPLQHLPSPRTTLPSSPRLRSPVGLLFSLRKPLFPADLCACRFSACRPEPRMHAILLCAFGPVRLQLPADMAACHTARE